MLFTCLFMDVAKKLPNWLQLIGFVFVVVTVFDFTTSGKFWIWDIYDATPTHSDIWFFVVSSAAHFLAQNKLGNEKKKKNADIYGYWAHCDETRKKKYAEWEKDGWTLICGGNEMKSVPVWVSENGSFLFVGQFALQKLQTASTSYVLCDIFFAFLK